MIRQEVRDGILRWREALVGVGVLVWGLWWGLSTYGLLFWIGWILALTGAGLLVAGIQRGRFRVGTGGIGVVEITEGRIGYFGPFTGGVVALSELSRLSLDPSAVPPCWNLSQNGQPDLCIPLDAEGADALFDVFAALPAINTGTLVAEVKKAMQGDQVKPVVIWERSKLRLH